MSEPTSGNDTQRDRIEEMVRALLAGGLADRGTEAVLGGMREILDAAEALVRAIDSRYRR